MNTDLNTVNASTGGVVDPNQQPIQQMPGVAAQGVNGVTEGVANPSDVTSQPQTPDVNASFAALRREKEAFQQQADLANQLIAKLYGPDGITDVNGLNAALTQAEQQALLEQQTQQAQQDPSFLIQKVNELNSKIEMMEEEKKSVERDRIIDQMKQQVQEVMQKAKDEGFPITEEDLLNTAQEKKMSNFHDVYKLLKPDMSVKEYNDKIISDYINGVKSGQIPVEGGGSTPSTVVQTPKSWEDAMNGTKAIFRANKMK